MYAFAQVGRTVYAGGRFNQVQDPARTTTYARQNFVAFDSETGVVSPLDLSFDGLVGAIEATADGTALFIAGAFSKVNGDHPPGDRQVRPGQQPDRPDLRCRRPQPNGVRPRARQRCGHRGGELHEASDGAGPDDRRRHRRHQPSRSPGCIDPTDETRVRHIAVSPNGTRLVATGNFATVNGQGRKRAFMVNLGATATLSTWHAPRFDVNCSSGGSRQDQRPGRGLLSRRLLLRDRRHRRTDRYQRRV